MSEPSDAKPEGRTIDQLTPEERVALRPMLIGNLAATGAMVMQTQVRGHLVAIVMPGANGEVSDADAPFVLQEIAAALEHVARDRRAAARLAFAIGRQKAGRS